MLAIPQVVNVERTIDVTLQHGLRVQRLLHGRSRRVRCTFAVDLHHGRARGPITCTLRVYRHRNLTGRLAVIPMSVTLVRRHRDISYEDGSGWRVYSPHRSLRFNPR